jgi:hypothetical protein
MKFIVDRSTWYRGQGVSDSKLLREDGQRCCIGFVGQQSGVSDSLLLDRPAICSMLPPFIQTPSYFHKKFPGWMLDENAIESQALRRAYSINDRFGSDYEREAELKALFAEQGDEIEFIN